MLKKLKQSPGGRWGKQVGPESSSPHSRTLSLCLSSPPPSPIPWCASFWNILSPLQRATIHGNFCCMHRVGRETMLVRQTDKQRGASLAEVDGEAPRGSAKGLRLSRPQASLCDPAGCAVCPACGASSAIFQIVIARV